MVTLPESTAASVAGASVATGASVGAGGSVATGASVAATGVSAAGPQAERMTAASKIVVRNLNIFWVDISFSSLCNLDQGFQFREANRKAFDFSSNLLVFS